MSEVAQICYGQGGFQLEQKAINLQTPILPLARSKEERLAWRVTKTALQSGVYWSIKGLSISTTTLKVTFIILCPSEIQKIHTNQSAHYQFKFRWTDPRNYYPTHWPKKFTRGLETRRTLKLMNKWSHWMATKVVVGLHSLTACITFSLRLA